MYSSTSNTESFDDEYRCEVFSDHLSDENLYDHVPSYSIEFDYFEQGSGLDQAVQDDFDIQLESLQSHKNKAWLSTKNRICNTKIVQPLRKSQTKSLLFPLEVLELVCVHLSQTTLRYSVSLVCKRWNRVSDRYIRRVGIWKPQAEDRQARLLAHMPKLDTLECWFNEDPDNVRYLGGSSSWELNHETWVRFTAALVAPLAPLEGHHSEDEIAPKCLLHHIKYLSFKGNRVTYDDAILGLQHCFEYLQALEIDIRDSTTGIPLFNLLANCHSLRDFKVTDLGRQETTILTGDEEDLIKELPEPVIDPETAHFPRKPVVVLPPKTYPQRYKLRVFDVSSVVVKQRVLERIIATCPDLRVFKLHEINKSVWVPELSIYRHYPIDEQRLWKHLKSCCPKVDWYHITLRVNTAIPDEPAILQLRNRFGDNGRSLTLTSSGYQPNFPHRLETRLALRHVTVLEIRLPLNYTFATENLHKLLCLMPSLMSLIAPGMSFAAQRMFETPANVKRPQYNPNNRARKRQERKDRRQRRQKALERIQASSLSPGGKVSTIPGVWECRDLRTMDLGFVSTDDDFCSFGRYVQRNHLLRNLTTLSTTVASFRVGQVKEIPSLPFSQPASELEVEPPARWENDLLLLRGLRCLELVRIKARSIPGLVYPRDFEFLRRTSDAPVVFFIPHRNKARGLIDIDGDNLAGASTGRGQQKPETFWPRLQGLYIRYGSASKMVSFADVVAGMEKLRPGVEFVVEHGNVPL